MFLVSRKALLGEEEKHPTFFLLSVVCACPNEERAEILDTQAEKLDIQWTGPE